MRKIIYALPVLSDREVYRFGNYKFTFKNKKPIPVEVPDSVAELLLKMQDRSCRCHYRPPRYLYKEI